MGRVNIKLDQRLFKIKLNLNLNTVIIGAGISGLSTANFLSKKITNFLIIESSDKVGGIIDSFESEGYTCENGPNTVLNNNMGVQELIDDLNLSEEIIYPDEQGVKNRYVLLNGKPAKIPLTFYDFFSTSLLSFFSKVRILSPFPRRAQQCLRRNRIGAARARRARECGDPFPRAR